MSETQVKTKKEVKSVLMLFYQGGTKVKAATAHTPQELEAIIQKAKKEVADAMIDTVNENEDVISDKLYMTRNALLFYSIYVPRVEAPKSDIVIAPAGAIASIGSNSR